MNGSKSQYAQAYSEVICMLKYFPVEYTNKLPTKLLEMLKKNSREEFYIKIDASKSLREQHICEKTKNVLATLNYNYWSNEAEKEKFKRKFAENERIYQEKLAEKYKSDNLFKNNQKELSTEKVAMIEYKETWIRKIINKVKSIFRM